MIELGLVAIGFVVGWVLNRYASKLREDKLRQAFHNLALPSCRAEAFRQARDLCIAKARQHWKEREPDGSRCGNALQEVSLEFDKRRRDIINKVPQFEFKPWS